MLRTSDIDAILGMDWMMKHQAVIQCKENVVVLTTSKGDRINVDVVVQEQPTAMVNQLNDNVNQQDCIVEEFLDFSLMTCQVCHLTMILSLLLNYYLELRP